MNALYSKRIEVREVRNTSRGQRRSAATLHSNVTRMALCLCLGLFGAGCVQEQTTKPDNAAHEPNPLFDAAYSKDADVAFVMEPEKATGSGSKKDKFQSQSASRRTRDMADWIVRSGDNENMPFAIIDKVNAFRRYDHSRIVLELAIAGIGHPVGFEFFPGQGGLDFLQAGHVGASLE